MVGKRGADSKRGQIAGGGVGRLGIQEAGAGQRQQKRLKRPRNKRTLDDESDLLHSRAAAQIQISSPRIAKPLRPCSSLAVSSWGAKVKRTRTAVGRWRDWASLGDGPAGLIAERVLADEVADYVRFRAVCRAWRRCCAARGALEDRRFHPRRWIMLLGHKEQLGVDDAPHRSCRSFLNTSTGQCVRVEVPELRDHGVLRSTTEGLLVLVRKATGDVRVLNPLTRHTAELPPLTTLDLHPGYFDRLSDTVGLVDGGTFMLCYTDFRNVRTIAFAKPGDERWALVRTHNIFEPLTPTMSFAGRFYGVASDAIMTVDYASGGPPRLVVAAKLSRPFQRMVDTMHLVDNGGELMLVHRMRRQRAYPATREPSESRRNYRWTYKVYRVDLEAGKATPARLLGGRAVFIGKSRALSVSPRVFPSIDANTVYPGLGLHERGGDKQIGAYHLRDGSIESYNYNREIGPAHPWSLVDCLAAYASG
ncbi:hypothetical protein ACP4OV_015778 [Aristida adscensionis]